MKIIFKSSYIHHLILSRDEWLDVAFFSLVIICQSYKQKNSCSVNSEILRR